MSAQENCLDYIIGLSETSCTCYTDNKPIDSSTTKSGLFLDKIDGLNLAMVDSASDCEEGNLWQMMAKSRENAISYFKNDLISSLLNKYKQKRQPFSGIIGSAKYTKTIPLSAQYNAMRIYCSSIISGVMSIKRIGTLFDTAGTMEVSVLRHYPNSQEVDIIGSYMISTSSNSLFWNNLDEPLVLPMNNPDYGDNPEYYLVYENSGLNPKDIRGGCGCGQSVYKYYWNLKNPVFRSFEKDRWSEFVMVTGTYGDDLSNRENWTTTEYLMGLMLDVDFKCNISDLICIDDMDFEMNPLALTMAHAIRYRSAAILIGEILSSGEINRYTMTGREEMMGKKNTYTKEYSTRIEYLTQQINYKANDCLTCDTFGDLMKTGIFS